jgi:segregation and condensation protein A
MYELQLEKFSGPLSLLLQLIEDQKLEITELSISQVTDQYLSYIEKLEEADPEEMSDFLVMAARLLVIKSRAILPVLEEEENLDDLQKQLKIYKEFLEASKKIEARLREMKFSYSRLKPPMEIKLEFSPAANLTMENLRQAFMAVLKKLDPIIKMPRQLMVKTVSLQQKILYLKDHLAKVKKIGLSALIGKAESKTEVIISFLAMLELVKQQHVRLSQSKLFEDIFIEKI